MSLDGSLFQELQQALLSAYPSREALQQFLFFRLNVRLDTIVPPGSLGTAIFELITWSEAHGRLMELAEQASADRPLRPDLADVVRRVREHVEGSAPPPGGSVPAAPAPAVNKPAIRNTLAAAFNMEDLALLCADIDQRLRDRGVANVPVDLDALGGGGKALKIQNLIDYLDRRGHLSELLEAARAVRPGIQL